MSFGTAGDAGVAEGDMVLVIFGLFARGELGRDGGACSFCGVDLGGGVDALVIILERSRSIAMVCGILPVASVVLVADLRRGA